MKKLFIACFLLFCVPLFADETEETPNQMQEKIAGLTATIAELKTQLRGTPQFENAVAYQEVSEKLMNNYSFRAFYYSKLQDWKNTKADIVEADQARRNLYYEKFKVSIEREAEFCAIQTDCNLHLGDVKGALNHINDARRAKGWDKRISADSLLGAKVNLYFNRPDDALADALDAQQRAQKNPRDAFVAISLAHYQKGDLDKAKAAWAEAVKLENGYEPIKLFDPTIAPLNAAIAQNPQDAKAWFRRGIAYQNGGDAYGRYVKGGDEDGSWFCNPTNFFDFSSSSAPFWDSAQRDFSRSYALDKNPVALVQRAVCLYSLSRAPKENKKSLLPPESTWQADAKQALKTGYKDYDAMHRLSLFHRTRALHLKAAGNEKSSKFAQNEANFIASIAVFQNPENPSAKTDVPVIAKDADKMIEATRGEAEDEELKLKWQVHTAEGWKEQGNKERAAGKEYLALQLYKKALEMDPQYADAQNNIGSVYASANDYPRAIEAFRAALKLDPQHRLAHSNLASNLRAMRLYKEALPSADSAVQFALTPEQKSAAFEIRSKLRLDLDKRAEALSDLREMLALDPKNARAWQNIGTVSLEDTDFESAREALQKCLDLNPQDSIVKVLMAMATNAAELPKIAQDKGKAMKDLSYSDWEAIGPAAQELLKSAILTASDKDALADYWNDMIKKVALGKAENNPSRLRAQSVLKVAIGMKPLEFKGTAEL